MPSGWDNNCEYKDYKLDSYRGEIDPHSLRPWTEIFPFSEDDGRLYALKTRPEVLHAESNCIAKLAKSTESGEDADLYITLSPCLDCAKLILQSGIKSVYYKTVYRDESGIQFLKKSNVSVEKL